MSQTHILIVDDNVTSTNMMCMLLKREGFKATPKNSPIEALKWLQIPGNRPDMIISDLNMPEMSGHDFIKQVKLDPLNKHIPIIMLTAQSSMAQKVAGFEAGVDDYLVKPVSSTELILRIKALLARAVTAAPTQQKMEATVFSVFSLRGGVGTSTIAVNLAVALAQLWGKNVPLIDLSLTNGHCALMLNIKPKNTLTTLAERDKEQIDAEIIESVLISHPSGVKLLPAPASPVEAELVTAATLEAIWPHFQSNYPFVVIDAGSQLNEVALAAFDRSHQVLLVFAPELASLKSTVDMFQVFKQLDYEAGRIKPVLNQTFAKGQLAKKDLESALRRPLDLAVPYDPALFVQAINSGQPIIETGSSTPPGLALAKMAYDLTPAEIKNRPPDTPSALLAKVQPKS